MYEIRFLHALAVTVVTETVLLFVIVRFLLRTSDEAVPWWHILACGVLCSGATLPYVWFVLPRFILSHSLFAFVAECFAVLAEIVIIRLVLSLPWRRSLLASLLCNLGSFGLGELIKAVAPGSLG